MDALRDLSVRVLPSLLDASVKAAAILLAAGGAAMAMRRASAAARQLLWLLALAGVLALPILSAALPDWRILPEWADPASARRWQPGPAAAPPVSIEPDPHPAPSGIDLGAHDPPGPSEPLTADAGEASTTPAPILPTRPPSAEARTWSARNVLPAIPLVWAVGVLACLAPHVLGRLSLWRLRRRSRPLTDGRWPTLMAETSGRLGLTRPVQLLISGRRTMPMIWGIFRPALLLPAEARSWTPQRRRVVLLHELAHARRRDCLTKLIAQLACAVYWFNPLVWIASAMGQRESERACDDLVLAAGSRPADYAEHILGIASGLQSPVLAAHSGIAMARKSRLEGRLLAILDRKRNRRTLTVAGVLLAVALVVGLVVPMSILKGSDGKGPADSAVPTWERTLSGGVRVELIGLAPHPSGGQAWWRPDGTPLPATDRPYGDPGKRHTTYRKGWHTVELALRLRGKLPDGVSLTCTSPTSSGFSSTRGPGLWHTTLEVPVDADDTDVRLGVAVGPWKTFQTTTGKGGEAGAGPQGSFMFSQAYEKDGQAALTVTHDKSSSRACRIVAVDKAGKVHKASRTSSSGVRGWTQASVRFRNLPLKQVREFRFQTRPYEWIELKHVRLSILSCPAGEAPMDRAAREAKENKDWKRLNAELAPLLKKWRDGKPRTVEQQARYDVRLLIDPAGRTVAIQQGGRVAEKVALPDGYEWELFHVIPAGTRKLSGPTVLKIRQRMQQRNICKELFLLRGVLGPDTGLCVDLKPLGLGVGLGTGHAKVPTRFQAARHKYKPGPNTINESMLVEEAPPTNLAVMEPLEPLWHGLGSSNYELALRDARTMAGRGDDATRVLERYLAPIPRDPEWIKARIAELGSDRHNTRVRAAMQLAMFGPRGTRAALTEAINADAGPEERAAVERLLAGLDKPAWSSPPGRQMDWAVAVLEAVDTRRSRRLLAKLAAGHPDAILTQLAKRAAERIAALGKAEAKAAPQILEFRMLAVPAGPGAGFVRVTDEDRKKYLAALAARGPVTDERSRDNFRWVRLDCPVPNGAVAAAYRGKPCLLVGNTWPRGVPGSFSLRNNLWELTHVRVVQGGMSAPAIEFTPSQMVADKLDSILSPNRGRQVAVVVDGKVLAILNTHNLPKGRRRIAGLFAARRARVLVKALERGMAPVHALCSVAAEGKVDEVRKLLDARPELARATVPRGHGKGDTALHKAASNNRKAVVELLLQRGADVNAANARGETPLRRAVDKDRRELAKLLLAHKADLTTQDAQGLTPLHVAALMCKPEMVALLIDHGADVNAKGKGGLTPLATAVMSSVMYGKDNPCVALLEQKGAKTDIFTAAALGKAKEVRAFIQADPQAAKTMAMGRFSPLHIAAAGGHEEVAGILLDAGAGVEGGANPWVPPLHLAASYGHKDVVELLLAHKADINSINADGGTAIDAAAYRGVKDMVELLLDRGAEISPTGRKTPLHNAVKGGQKAVAELLIARGAKVNSELLVYLAQQAAIFSPRGQGYVVKPDLAGTAAVLIDHGADVNFGAGKATALHKAVKTMFNRKPDLDLIRLLLKRGADVHARDSRGWTPLHHTGQHNRVEAAKLLLAAGADPLIESELTSPSCTTPLDEARKYKKGKDVAELLAKAAAPRIKATEREVRKVAEAFGRAVRDSDDKALLTVTHQPPHMGVKNVWTQWAGTIRKEYATGPELLDTVDSVFSRGVWAEAYIPRPAGDKNTHMVLLLMRWPDGRWRVIDRSNIPNEPAKAHGQRIHDARMQYGDFHKKVYSGGTPAPKARPRPRPAPAASGGRPKASTDRDGPPAVSATGQVVDASGRPVAGAVVRAYEPHQDETGRTKDIVLADETTTKADGSFRLTWKPGRTAYYWPILIARKPGMALGWRDWDYRKMADLHVTIALLKPTKLAGVVVDEQGRPVSGAVVRATLKRPDKDDTFGTWIARRRPLEWLTAETDESGRFSFHEVPVGVGAEFFVTAPGRAKLSTRNLRPASFKPQFAAGRTDIRITLPLEAIIAGTVVDKAAGTGVAGVRVRSQWHGGSHFHEATAVSDRDGRFRLAGLRGGTHRLELVRSRRRLADWVAEKTEVETAPGKMTSGVKLPVRKGGVLEIAVIRDADAKGVPDAFVNARGMRSSSGPGQSYPARTGAAGVAKIRVLPGRYRLSVSAPGYNPILPSPKLIADVADGGTKPVTLRLKTAAQARGVVRDPAGEPVAGAIVSAVGAHGRRFTAKDGTFNLSMPVWDDPIPSDCSPPWQYTLIVRHPKRNLAAVAGLGTDPKPVNVTLRAGVTLEVRVTDADGRPFPNARVSVLLNRPHVGGSVGYAYRTGKDGRRVLPAVPTGHDYSLWVEARGFAQKKSRLTIAHDATGTITRTIVLDTPKPATTRPAATSRPAPTSRPAVDGHGTAGPASRPASQPAGALLGRWVPPTTPHVKAKQLQRIRELVYVLRTMSVGSRIDQWTAAMMELATIGTPAVPELVAELDRNPSDATRRAIAFTLRVINDPRAVPALIRALPRASSGSLGLPVLDRRAHAFMARHELGRKEAYPRFVLGNAVRETAAALEALTGHSEGSDYIRAPIQLRAGDVKRVRDLRRQAAGRWRVWWGKNQGKFVTAAELAALPPTSAATDPVGAAGLARFGPIFPTGRGLRLGPVREVTVDPQGTRTAKAFVDLDTGRRFSRYEGYTPTGDRDVDWITWMTSAGIDAYAGTPGSLQGWNVHVWQVDNARWDGFARELGGPGPIKLGRVWPTYGFMPRGLLGRRSSGKLLPPATFLFTTGAGGRGILQILPVKQGVRPTRIRYRMVERATASTRPAATTRPAPRPPIAEVVLSRDPKGPGAAIDLDTGKTFFPAEEVTEAGTFEAALAWMQAVGIDGGLYFSRTDHGLGLCDAATVKIPDDQWPDPDGKALARVQAAGAQPKLSIKAIQDGPETWLVRTREGGVGVIRISDVPGKVHHVRVQFRMFKTGKVHGEEYADISVVQGWSGRKATVPGPLAFPAWLKSTSEWKKWEYIGVVRNFTTWDAAGNKYVASAMGFVKTADGVRKPMISSLALYRADGTRKAMVHYAEGLVPTSWTRYDAKGRKTSWVITRPDGAMTKRVVRAAHTYEPDGTARQWQINRHGVVRGEMVTPPDGKSYYARYAKPFERAPFDPRLVAEGRRHDAYRTARTFLSSAAAGHSSILGRVTQDGSPAQRSAGELVKALRSARISASLADVTVSGDTARQTAKVTGGKLDGKTLVVRLVNQDDYWRVIDVDGH